MIHEYLYIIARYELIMAILVNLINRQFRLVYTLQILLTRVSQIWLTFCQQCILIKHLLYCDYVSLEDMEKACFYHDTTAIDETLYATGNLIQYTYACMFYQHGFGLS